MSGYRVGAPHGGRIDRSRVLRLSVDGRTVAANPGDTLASALLASGAMLAGRSFKLHRPRGIVAAGADEPNALFDIGEGAARTPNCRATDVLARDGLAARSGNAWPSPRLDIVAPIGRFAPLLPAGFYYKTFKWPHWKLFEPAIRRLAGLGHAPDGADPQRYDEVSVATEVLVVGAGAAGLAAATAAARAGRQVVLAEADVAPGGWMSDQAGDAARLHALLADAAAAGVQPLLGCTVFGLYDHGLAVAVQRMDTADEPGAHAARLWKFRTRQIVLATGAFERPLLFPANDRPGVMSAQAVQRYLAQYGVACGRRVLLATACDSGYGVAAALRDAGIELAAIVDRRDAAAIGAAPPSGVAQHTGSAIVAVRGRRAVSGVAVGGAHRLDVDCDLVACAGGFTPNVNLYSQAGGRLAWDERASMFVPSLALPGVAAVGACAGRFDVDGAIAHAAEIGCSAVGAALPPPGAAGLGSVPADSRPDPAWLPRRAGKVFVDLQNDVSAADVELAAREGYRSVEHFKRYTTNGMATDQGKTSNVNGLVVLGAATGRAPAQVGTTKFRPPERPVTIGAIVGERVGARYRPLRRLPAEAFHAARCARFEEFGGWWRPAAYPVPGETLDDAAQREATQVRAAVAVFDGSPLGKIEVAGPDAADFLDRMYVGTMSTVPVGGARYGVLLHENGVVADDGIVARLGEQHFLVHTTSAGAERVAAAFEEWLQCEYVRHDVFVVPVTGQWANLSVAGPRAWTLLERIGIDPALAPARLPHMSLRCSAWRGAPLRVLRASFHGELGYEINLPPSRCTEFLETLERDGNDLGVGWFGIEALMVLRIEKGYVHIGADSDGTTLPHDLGLARAVAAKRSDFAGRRSLQLPAALDEDRLQLVGLQPQDRRTPLPVGAQLAKAPPPAASEGHVTSSAFSPARREPVALALLRRGRARVGERLLAWHRGASVAVDVVPLPFVDPDGERLRG